MYTLLLVLKRLLFFFFLMLFGSPDLSVTNIFLLHLLQLTETNSSIKCLDSMCCFSEGETACASVGRMLERVIGRCSPSHVSRCEISLSSLCCRWVYYKLEQVEPTSLDNLISQLLPLPVEAGSVLFISTLWCYFTLWL